MLGLKNKHTENNIYQILFFGLINITGFLIMSAAVYLWTHSCWTRRKFPKDINFSYSKTLTAMTRIINTSFCTMALLGLHTHILYGASIGCSAMAVKSSRRSVSSVYSICAVRVSCSYRTVSDDAGMPPVELWTSVGDYKQTEAWKEQEWDESDKGR